MEQNEHVEALNDIRKMMQRSSRFLSLSGLSGVFAGLYALGGAYIAYVWQEEFLVRFFQYPDQRGALELEYFIKFGALAMLVLTLSLATGLFFSARKAKKAGQKLFDYGAKLLFTNLAVPLMAGGAFCLLLIMQNEILLVAPALLIFYGISLMAAGKYTLDEVRYLGICEILLGLLNGFFFLGEGLLFWAIGFGVLHIVYGLVMWNKYDRVKK